VDGKTDVREHGLHVVREVLPGALPDDDAGLRDGKFGEELLEIGIDNVFARLWGKSHVQIARNNGLPEDTHGTAQPGPLDWSQWSHLGESNPRPIHYE
jgi:hypothetical protein